MKIMILGGDGYLGWPTAMHLSTRGHDVVIVDNYLRRKIATQTNSEPLFKTPELAQRVEIFANLTGNKIEYEISDLNDFSQMYDVIHKHQPESIVHYAEQPSAPYSMMGFEEANLTFQNNLGVTFNLIWAVSKLCPEVQIVKLGTMGEYGTPNIDIEEGWIDIEHNGRKDTVLFPRAASSLYHTTKVLDTDLLWFYVRNNKLKVTDLMQGPVYGIETAETVLDDRLLPHFNYDDIFGTVINRFLVQSVSGIPLTVYGEGGQTRGYININDTLKCVELAILNSVKSGELRIFNQITETFSVNEIAQKIQSSASQLGLPVEIQHIANPRIEKENHYYNPKYTGLKDLGLNPHLLNDEVLQSIIKKIMVYKKDVCVDKVYPRAMWK